MNEQFFEHETNWSLTYIYSPHQYCILLDQQVTQEVEVFRRFNGRYWNLAFRKHQIGTLRLGFPKFYCLYHITNLVKSIFSHFKMGCLAHSASSNSTCRLFHCDYICLTHALSFSSNFIRSVWQVASAVATFTWHETPFIHSGSIWTSAVALSTPLLICSPNNYSPLTAYK